MRRWWARMCLGQHTTPEAQGSHVAQVEHEAQMATNSSPIKQAHAKPGMTGITMTSNTSTVYQRKGAARNGAGGTGFCTSAHCIPPIAQVCTRAPCMCLTFLVALVGLAAVHGLLPNAHARLAVVQLGAEVAVIAMCPIRGHVRPSDANAGIAGVVGKAGIAVVTGGAVC